MGEHAILSASSAYRWLKCTPAPRLEQQFQEQSSVFAEEGTAAHTLSEYKLKTYLGQTLNRPESDFDSEELDTYTDSYVNYAKELIAEARNRCKDAIILVEQRLDFSKYVPSGFGTGDLVIVSDEILDICDLKYGKGVEVSAENNPQMKLYALGALGLFDSLYDIKTIRMSICQPRLENISVSEITVGKLIEWAETELKEKANLAIKGEGDFQAGEHCRFCKARHTCRARADSFLEIAKYDFKLPSLLTDDEIASLLEKTNQISNWAADVWAYATDMAITQNKSWTGYKLVESRSNRKYINEESVSKTLTDAGIVDIYKQSLIGISEMERKLGKKKFSELLSALIEKPLGKPTLVKDSDKRSEIKTNTAEADFKK